MTTEIQDLTWACLPKEARDNIKRDYNTVLHNPRLDKYDSVFLTAFENLFGHNLTSSTEPEEMLIVSRSMIQNKYAYNESILELDPTHQGAILLKKNLDFLFGDKCLPDPNPKDHTDEKSAKFHPSDPSETNSASGLSSGEIEKNNRCEKCGATAGQCANSLCQNYPIEEKEDLTDFEIRLFAYERAQRDISLATGYVSFLKDSSDHQDLELRMRTLEVQEGKPLEKVKKVYLFLKGFVEE